MAKDPDKLGKYDIVGKLGKGAMGEVYKGHDPVLNRYVAIKVIAETLDTDPDLVERFRREAKMAAQLNHPNIITIFDFVEEEGSLYIVMELLEGQDLKELIKNGAPLTVDQMIGMMEQIADGLGFAHESGLVHRDLKPANIHVTKKGQIKILDFGLVHDASSDMTKTGHVMGTPNYMSPEQVQGLKVDPRSDIFSLGAVFYELLTRKKPFSADSIHATMFKVVQGEREPLSQYTHLPQLCSCRWSTARSIRTRTAVSTTGTRCDELPPARSAMSVLSAPAPLADSDDRYRACRARSRRTLGPEPGSHPSAPPGSPIRSGSRSAMSAAAGRKLAASQRRRRAPRPPEAGGTMRRRDMTGPSMSELGRRRRSLRDRSGSTWAAAVRRRSRSAGGSSTSCRVASEPGCRAERRGAQPGAHREPARRSWCSSLEANATSDRRVRAQADELLASDPSEHRGAQGPERSAGCARSRSTPGWRRRSQALEGWLRPSSAADALEPRARARPGPPARGTELHALSSASTSRDRPQQAQAEMDRAPVAGHSRPRRDASEFQQPPSSFAMAANGSDFNAGDYTSAAQKYPLRPRPVPARARAAQQQSASAEQAAGRRPSGRAGTGAGEAGSPGSARPGPAERPGRLDPRAQPSRRTTAVDGQLPSYERALVGGRGRREAARRPPEISRARPAGTRPPTSYLEIGAKGVPRAGGPPGRAGSAAESRRLRGGDPHRRRRPPRHPPAAPRGSHARAQEEAAIRRRSSPSYERAIETEDIGLFQQVKPNTTAGGGPERLEDSFET